MLWCTTTFEPNAWLRNSSAASNSNKYLLTMLRSMARLYQTREMRSEAQRKTKKIEGPVENGFPMKNSCKITGILFRAFAAAF
jgi:hypothetical protein